jgi:hypothetical protein
MGARITCPDKPWRASRPRVASAAPRSARQALLQSMGLRLGNIPQDHMVVGDRHSWMPVVGVHVHMIHLRMGDGKLVERLAGCEVLERKHINRAHEVALAVIGQKRPDGEGVGLDVQHPKAGEKLGQGDERAELPKIPPGGACSHGSCGLSPIPGS